MWFKSQPYTGPGKLYNSWAMETGKPCAHVFNGAALDRYPYKFRAKSATFLEFDNSGSSLGGGPFVAEITRKDGDVELVELKLSDTPIRLHLNEGDSVCMLYHRIKI